MHLLLILVVLPSIALADCPASKIPSSEVKDFLGAHNKLRSTIASGKYVAQGNQLPAAKNGIPDLVSHLTG